MAHFAVTCLNLHLSACGEILCLYQVSWFMISFWLAEEECKKKEGVWGREHEGCVIVHDCQADAKVGTTDKFSSGRRLWERV